MKKLKTALASLSILLLSSIVNSQTINCSDFTLLGYGPDSLNPGNSVVHIQFAADPMDFINYPYVSFVTDCNGDTIATGNMNFFGQMGQSVQSYPVTGDITNACLPITVEFIYANTNFETDTCLLTLNATIGISESSAFESTYSIYPNPSKNVININSSLNKIGINYFIYDYTGKLILTGRLNSESTAIEISDFSNGIYLLKIGNDFGETFKVVKE